MLGEKDIPKIVDCDILAFPHARYPPLGERAPEQMTAVCVIMLPICLCDTQNHSQIDDPAEYAVNLPLDAKDHRLRLDFVDCPL